MTRLLQVYERYNIYYVSRDGETLGQGRTIEKALGNAAVKAGVGDPEVHSWFDACEVIESMLGPKKIETDGVIHT